MGAPAGPTTSVEPLALMQAGALATDQPQPPSAAVAGDWLATVVDSSMEGIVSFGLDLRVRSWNSGAQRIFGYAARECVGQPLTIMGPAEERAMHENVRRLERGERLQFEATRVRKDGSEVQVAMDVTPVRDAAGAVIGGMSIVRDVTEARLAQVALQRSQQMLTDALRELADANEAKDRFIATLSHELRNPLASIASSVEVLAEAGVGSDLRAHALDIVRRQTATMRHLLDDLLDVARLRLGRLSMRPAPTTLREVVRMAEDTVRPAVHARGHRLDVALPPHEVPIHGDKVRIAQVLSNLLGNAAKYTPPHGHIRLEASVHDTSIRVVVHDNGIGLDTTELESVFGLFVQAEHGGEATASGLGIGLALARSIAQLHGGTLQAESGGRGQGSRFVLLLPIVDSVHQAGEPAPVAPARAPGQGGTLLLVDDNADALWGLSMVLERAGYRVLTATSAEEALAIAGQARPEVLLLDIGLPGASGHELARRVRDTDWGRTAMVIALTGRGQKSDVQQSHEAGFDAHLTKPADVGELRRLLARPRGIARG